MLSSLLELGDEASYTILYISSLIFLQSPAKSTKEEDPLNEGLLSKLDISTAVSTASGAKGCRPVFFHPLCIFSSVNALSYALQNRQKKSLLVITQSA